MAFLALGWRGMRVQLTAHARSIFHEEVDEDDLGGRRPGPVQWSPSATQRGGSAGGACGPDARRVRRIYNGPGSVEFFPSSPGSRAPFALARGADHGRGRLVEKKGFDVLVDACACSGSGISFECRIVGSGEEEVPSGGGSRDSGLGGGGADDRFAPRPRTGVIQEMRGPRLRRPCVEGSDGNRVRALPPSFFWRPMALGIPSVSTTVTWIPGLVEDR